MSYEVYRIFLLGWVGGAMAKNMELITIYICVCRHHCKWLDGLTPESEEITIIFAYKVAKIFTYNSYDCVVSRSIEHTHILCYRESRIVWIYSSNLFGNLSVCCRSLPNCSARRTQTHLCAQTHVPHSNEIQFFLENYTRPAVLFHESLNIDCIWI